VQWKSHRTAANGVVTPLTAMTQERSNAGGFWGKGSMITSSVAIKPGELCSNQFVCDWVKYQAVTFTMPLFLFFFSLERIDQREPLHLLELKKLVYCICFTSEVYLSSISLEVFMKKWNFHCTSGNIIAQVEISLHKWKPHCTSGNLIAYCIIWNWKQSEIPLHQWQSP
jgi:hypothetical protein